ncbi:MAG: helix-turn-helix transcriptional regulator [Abitibacteriaceae bacterium]|nr:helix-turn-helix transcriptional regulator [Abditibacteriaceae bacterium]MBV9866173.1 helix-turn-helix transcriptional regulator [Abditibacteriaceae bacterium]
MPETLAQQMGIVIRSLRTEVGLSQEELAARCGLHRTYIGSIERGEKTITIETAQKLAKAFEISLTQLFSQLESQDGCR